MKQVRSVRTREAILAGAAAQFDTRGYGNTSLNAILDACGYARGGFYHHFPSKEAIAQQLVVDWRFAVDEAVNEVTLTDSGSAIREKLTAIFTSLARRINAETNVRAGMKLTLESAVDTRTAFTSWVEIIDGVVDTAIAAGEIDDAPIVHRLAWNLCAGTVGATYASAIAGDDVDLVTRIEEAVAAHLRTALT
ncbi:TetR family transcriptional regulator [Rhodococcus erythropolis]|uniref:TetR family transcriptional regulator n=1 Tax=Rhodococcus erythropolis TaxID=1833 RepID=UPI00366CBEBC